MSKILILMLFNLQQYSTYKPDFLECRVFKNYDGESF